MGIVGEYTSLEFYGIGLLQYLPCLTVRMHCMHTGSTGAVSPALGTRVPLGGAGVANMV